MKKGRKLGSRDETAERNRQITNDLKTMDYRAAAKKYHLNPQYVYQIGKKAAKERDQAQIEHVEQIVRPTVPKPVTTGRSPDYQPTAAATPPKVDKADNTGILVRTKFGTIVIKIDVEYINT